MKYAVICLSLIVIIFSGTSLFAQSDLTYVLYTGMSNPIAPNSFNDLWNKGINIGFSVEKAVNSIVAFNVSLDVDRFGLNESNYLNPNKLQQVDGVILGPEDIGNAYFFTLSGNTKIKIPAISSYIIGGLGVFQSYYNKYLSTQYVLIDSETYERMPELENETVFAANIGAGMNFRVRSRLNMYVEARYINVFTRVHSTTYAPLRFGFRIR